MAKLRVECKLMRSVYLDSLRFLNAIRYAHHTGTIDNDWTDGTREKTLHITRERCGAK